MKAALNEAIEKNSREFGIEEAVLRAFMDVEAGGEGFHPRTGKILIQFEPAWFRKKAPYAPSGLWSVNKVDIQSKEWIAFNDAFRLNPEAAMESTSIGIGQVMGFNYKRLGYSSVGEMWDDAKKGIDRQIWQICKYIDTDPRLRKAIDDKNWHLIATYYNGAGYKNIATKYGREPYDISMRKAYEKYLKK